VTNSTPAAARRRLPRLTPLGAVLAAAAALAACTSAPRAGRGPGTFQEALVEVPRETRIAVGIAHEKARLSWLETHYTPKPKDVEAARAKDPGDKTVALFRFYYENGGYVSHRASLRVLLLDEAGGVLAEGGRAATLDAQVQEDTISFPVSFRTVDWPRAAKVKVLATFLD